MDQLNNVSVAHGTWWVADHQLLPVGERNKDRAFNSRTKQVMVSGWESQKGNTETQAKSQMFFYLFY